MATSQLKSYYTRTVESALSLARSEFGPDVLLVESKKAAPAEQHRGTYEVTFAVNPGPATWTGVEEAGGLNQRVLVEIEALRSMIDRLSFRLAPGRGAQSQDGLNPAIDCELRLVKEGFSPEIAAELAGRAMDQGQNWAPAVRRLLTERIETRSTIISEGRRGTVLVGPPGAGKTTTLVKVAARLAVEQRRRCLIVTLDNERVGAASQLHELATILGVPFQALDSPEELETVLRDLPAKQVVLVDTPGFGGRETAAAGSLARGLKPYRAHLETHLVLPANLRSADLAGMAHRYAAFAPECLAFSHLDETRGLGGIWNECERWRLPVSFLCSGQAVPEDFDQCTPAELADIALAMTVVGGGVQ